MLLRTRILYIRLVMTVIEIGVLSMFSGENECGKLAAMIDPELPTGIRRGLHAARG